MNIEVQMYSVIIAPVTAVVGLNTLLLTKRNNVYNLDLTFIANDKGIRRELVLSCVIENIDNNKCNVSFEFSGDILQDVSGSVSKENNISIVKIMQDLEYDSLIVVYNSLVGVIEFLEKQGVTFAKHAISYWLTPATFNALMYIGNIQKYSIAAQGDDNGNTAELTLGDNFTYWISNVEGFSKVTWATSNNGEITVTNKCDTNDYSEVVGFIQSNIEKSLP